VQVRHLPAADTQPGQAQRRQGRDEDQGRRRDGHVQGQGVEESAMNHFQKVVVFIVGALNRLKEKGLVSGGRYDVTPEGKLTFDDLEAEGFRPTRDDIRQAVTAVGDDLGVPREKYPEFIEVLSRWDEVKTLPDSKE
jgi:hypothetical protein